MAAKTLKERTISGMIWASVQKFGTLGITFIANIILARLLTPDDYGMIGMLAIFIAISNTFIDGGFGSALIQKSKPSQTDYSSVFYFNILLSVILYSLLYFCAPAIESFYSNIHGLTQILRVQGIVLIINSFNIVQFNQLRKQMNFKTLSWINISSAFFSVIVAIIMAINKYGVWSLVFQQISLSFANTVLLWLYCRWTPLALFSWKSIKQLFGFGSYIMFSSLLNTIGNNLNSLLIGKFFSASTLGYFSQAKKIEDISSTGILNVVEQVSYPMLVEVKNDYDKMIRVLIKFNNLFLVIVMPFMFWLVLSARPVIVFLFSDKWLESVPILQVLAIHGIFFCMQGSSYNAIAAIGKSQVLFKWTIIKRIINLIILIVSLLLCGFWGLLWGIVLSGLIITSCNMYLLSKHINFRLWDQIKNMLPVILTSTLPFILCLTSISVIKIETVSTNTHDLGLGILYVIMYIFLIMILPITTIKNIRHEIVELVSTRILHRVG